MHAYFDQIERVRFEGVKSTNPLAFRHYNPDEVILGKTMAEHLRFAACYWRIRPPVAKERRRAAAGEAESGRGV